MLVHQTEKIMYYKLFVELIQVAICHRNSLSRVPSTAEWSMLYSLSVKQAVAGVCFCGVERLPKEQLVEMPARLKLQWFALATQIKARNELLNHRCVEVQRMLTEEGMKSCILKGQGVAKLYKIWNEELEVRNGVNLGLYRQSGDIDVWVDKVRDEVIDFVMQIAPTREFDEKHIHFHVFEDVDVEMHWIPVNRESPRFNRILGKYFRKESERQFANSSGKVCYPTVDFQVVHQLLHVYAHYVYEGVGLRQMMDLYFAQVAFLERMPQNMEEVLGLFKRLGLMKFVAATQWVLGEVFQLPRELMLCEPDADEGQQLLDEIMIGGNFGHHDERNHVEGESFFGRFFRRWGRKFRMFRFDPLGTILMPFSRIKLEIRMRKVRKQYKV